MHQPHVTNISMSAGQMHWFEEKEIDVRRRTNQWWQFLSPCSIFLGMRFWVLPLRPPPCVHYATVPWFFLVAPPPCIQQPEVWFSNLSLDTHGSGRTSQHWQCSWWCDDLFHKILFQDEWTKGILSLIMTCTYGMGRNLFFAFLGRLGTPDLAFSFSDLTSTRT